jgi:predicted nucleic acid-binding protein
MSRVFVDTHFYIAVLSGRDAWHDQAMGILSEDQFPDTVTTVGVILELADGMARLGDRRRCADFIDQLQSSVETNIVPLNTELMARGLKLYAARLDKEWSLTDCISFTVMADEGLSEALTADRHFEQAGFRALLA